MGQYLDPASVDPLVWAVWPQAEGTVPRLNGMAINAEPMRRRADLIADGRAVERVGIVVLRTGESVIE